MVAAMAYKAHTVCMVVLNSSMVLALICDRYWLQGTTFKDTKAALNRSVVKVHERLARDLTKVVGDDRELRMQALKANDFARYQEMLKATAGAEAAQDERCALMCLFELPCL